jgi:hypothetical protein
MKMDSSLRGKRGLAALLALMLSFVALAAAAQTEPDYSEWNRILKTYYDPLHGMDYAALKAKDMAAMQALRQRLGGVNAAALSAKARQAYWMNVYNVNTIATVLESYPVKSIRDISTDPIIRLNVFKKERIPYGGRMLSLDDVETREIREAFNDPRIHFAINCAARSCPPLHTEAFTGARLDAQLDGQTRSFLNGPLGVRLTMDGTELKVKTTKIMDWFGKDFGDSDGSKAAFIRNYIPADKQRLIDLAKTFDFDYDSYDWALNDWRR